MDNARPAPIGAENQPESDETRPKENTTATQAAGAGGAIHPAAVLDNLIARIFAAAQEEIARTNDDGWITDAAEELDRLTADKPSNLARKRQTIIALADAAINRTSQESVWRRPDTCSRKIYHEKWKSDPIFADVRDRVIAIAQDHRSRRGLKSTQAAANVLDLASLPAALRLALETTNADPNVAIRAGKEVLDRITDTAAKTSTATGTIADWRADAERRRRLADETIEAYEDDEIGDDDAEEAADDAGANTSRGILPDDAGADSLE